MFFSWEIALVLAAGTLAVVAVLRRDSGNRTAEILLAFVILTPLVAGAAFWRPGSVSPAEGRTPPKTTAQDYVSSATCRACHPDEYASWHESYHRTMTQVVSAATVAAPLEAVSLTGRGRTFHVEVRDGQLWVDDVDGIALRDLKGGDPTKLPRRTGFVVMSTGSHHLQVYWLRDEEGIYHQVTWNWLIRDQRWVPTEDVYLQPRAGTLGTSASWATNCIKCHSVGGEPRLRVVSWDRQSIEPATTRVGELGIACEACHGPAAEHVRTNRNPLRRYYYHLTGEADPTITNPDHLSSDMSAHVCGRCHSGQVHLDWDDTKGASHRPGDPLEDHFALRTFETTEEQYRSSYFWSDGTSRVTGREYTALAQSRCYSEGEITCRSCHSLHDSAPNDQLAAGMAGDRACLQCHSEFETQIAEHSHHPVESSGARCTNCHMPNTTYGLLMLTRSHRIDSPALKRGDRPNACNLCHVDRSLAWTAEKLAQWYGEPATQPVLDEAEATLPAALVWLERGDGAQRATAAWHLGWQPARAAAGEHWPASVLASALADQYSAVRYLAGRSIKKLPGFETFEYDFLTAPRHQVDAVRRARALAGEHRSGPGPFDHKLLSQLRSQRDRQAVYILE